VRWLRCAICVGGILSLAAPVFPQADLSSAISPGALLKPEEAPLVGDLQFSGLRRIAPEAVTAQIILRAGDRLDLEKIDKDIHALARLGWFESIQVEELPSNAPGSDPPNTRNRIALLFHLEERPFLSQVAYSGSHLLSQEQIEKLLEEKKLKPVLGEPADPMQLQRIAATLQSGMRQLEHPDASVQIRRVEAPNGTVSVRFEMNDGPHLPVREVRWEGHPGLSEKILRAQMQSIAPWKPFSSLRQKDAYSLEAFEADRHHLLDYFQNHGYPEARIGYPQVSRISQTALRWFPWPHPISRSGLSLSIPVEAGPLYRFESVLPSPALEQAANHPSAKSLAIAGAQASKSYSAAEVDKLQDWWQARLQPGKKSISAPYPGVATRQSFNAEDHTVRVSLDLSDSPPYVVRRIEFLGVHRFSDRYVRRKMLLREGQPVNNRALEAGLARLARTGYFRQIRKEDIHIHLDDVNRGAYITIRLEEIGRQRSSFVGGNGQLGKTAGVIYTVFDLLNREELLSAQLDGGPESVQVMLGIAKEGIFGTRGTLALSIFDNVIRPRFAQGPQGPFFDSHTEGITVPWIYGLTSSDTLGVSYSLSRTASKAPLPASFEQSPNISPAFARTETSSHALVVSWLHDTPEQRVLFSGSASGSFLGGSENMVRSTGQYSRIVRDPVFSSENSWAFRTTFSGAGSYRGDMPFYSRFFYGDDMVRGLKTGGLGPDELTTKINSAGLATFSPAPAGSNLLTAANAEYRAQLAPGVQAAGFFDTGAGWLLPNWLGPAKPTLLGATNGVLHGSTGIELRWQVPGIQVPFRVYYAINVLRLDRTIHLSAKSIFFARNPFSAFGWGLGSLF
jgi:outer membrane protein assembly complex protein YaeT